MTEQGNDLDRAERIRRLQARRPEASSTAPLRPKRGHPAAATRWMLAGLSMASFFTIGGAVAIADQTPVDAPQPASSSTADTAPSSTPRSTTSNGDATPAPHTTTRGS